MMTNLTERENQFFAALQPLEESRLRIVKDFPLAQVASFSIGGPADIALWPGDAEALAECVRAANLCKLPFTVIGNASNVLFDDEGYRGVILFTTKMSRIRREKETLTADCGTLLSTLALRAKQENLGGLEFLWGIPGSLGGAIYMNGGAFEHCIGDTVVETVALCPATGEIVIRRGKEHGFAYRQSCFMESGDILLSATLQLHTEDSAQIGQCMEEHLRYRQEHQPLNYPSAGSVFKRYPGYYVSRLIEQAGLKGLSVGGAQVSEKHAGFIINRGGATAADVFTLIDRIKAEIFDRYGIHIECEIIPVNAKLSEDSPQG